MTPAIDLSRFAVNDDEAAFRFAATRDNDPFPHVLPSLLNSADLMDYIAATGMIHPFRPDPADPTRSLKPASCGIGLGGPYLYWDQPQGATTPVERYGSIDEAGGITLDRNSIVFLTLRPMFRLPSYIAARFNLQIRDVYRGLLVGTGPLVDPGFEGQLSIPVHNLTANTYSVRADELIVWMEFTKISPNTRWARAPSYPPADRFAPYVEFPRRKRERGGVREYARLAHLGPIRSSIPGLVGDIEKQARQASQSAQQAARSTRRFTIGATIGAILTGLALLAALITMGVQVLSTVNDIHHQDNALPGRVDALAGNVRADEAKIAVQAKELAALRRPHKR